jgi:hypothetical protein
MNPEYPVFVPTKGRHERLLTIHQLEKLHIPYRAVIEEQEYGPYSACVPREKLLVLPHRGQGLTVTRNWIWEYARQELKAPYFWTIDDNIRAFYRLHRNIKWRLTSGTFLRVMENFAARYQNLYICGMAYEMFAPRRQKHHPVMLNTRIYSNMLIRADIPYRNRLFYNDDTDLCLQVLKGGHCTAEFNVFLAQKVATMYLKGGMTDYYEQTNQRLEFARELQQAHPDVVRIVRRYGRWHHQVDYRPFRANRLRLRPGVVVPHGVDNFGLVCRKRESASP